MIIMVIMVTRRLRTCSLDSLISFIKDALVNPRGHRTSSIVIEAVSKQLALLTAICRKVVVGIVSHFVPNSTCLMIIRNGASDIESVVIKMTLRSQVVIWVEALVGGTLLLNH